MAGSNMNRYSSYTNASAGSDNTKSSSAEKKDLWSSLLDSVASGRRLPEKNLLVLGGSVDSQREFLESLASDSGSLARRATPDDSNKTPPVANAFALGYTYYDVLDADHEDTLARVSLYTLTTPSPAFSSLLAPLLTPQSIPNTLIVVLLDWSEPWRWARQLREWILLLRRVVMSLSTESKDAMVELMTAWRERGRPGGTTNLDGTAAAPATEGAGVSLPIGPGEWEDELGLPLCVVCQNAEKMELLEKTQGWREEEFDMVLQFMRTILLRHGASLVYTTPSTPSQLPVLVHSSLGIHSLLKKQPLKHNVIERDKITVPPNWDSWAKIRLLRDGFDPDVASNGWSIDLGQPLSIPQTNGAENGATDVNGEAQKGHEDLEGSAVAIYEAEVQDPSLDALQIRKNNSTGLEVETTDPQSFLGQQLKLLENFRQQSEKEAQENPRAKMYKKISEADETSPTEGKVTDHIGPVQFNMGGIQVDADDMVQRLKDRQTYASSPDLLSQDQETEEDARPNTENLQAFFTGLMNRRGAK